MTSVTLKPTNVASFPDGGGHSWVFLQYAHALRQLGCEVHWLERFQPGRSYAQDRRALRLFRNRLAEFDLADRIAVYQRSPNGGVDVLGDCNAFNSATATDLLLDFDYLVEPALLDRFGCTALVDIDPGLLQFWVSAGQLTIAEHDRYASTGETVGTDGARFSDLGRSWIRFRPPVCLDLWPFAYDPDATTLTTVSGWWGGDGKGEWVTDGEDIFFENNKRVTFLELRQLPQWTDQRIELALALGDGDESLTVRNSPDRSWRPSRLPPSGATDYVSDQLDRAALEQDGWIVRHAREVASTPRDYRRYVQQSRGEFSCAKPSCRYFQNAWVSDRTLCYLASGKPVVVQDTGPSRLLPSGEGMFRFTDVDGALAAIEELNAHYRHHCEAARELARSFDAPTVLVSLLDQVLSGGR